jgi:hypothetical protein
LNPGAPVPKFVNTETAVTGGVNEAPLLSERATR